MFCVDKRTWNLQLSEVNKNFWNLLLWYTKKRKEAKGGKRRKQTKNEKESWIVNLASLLSSWSVIVSRFSGSNLSSRDAIFFAFRASWEEWRLLNISLSLHRSPFENRKFYWMRRLPFYPSHFRAYLVRFESLSVPKLVWFMINMWCICEFSMFSSTPSKVFR